MYYQGSLMSAKRGVERNGAEWITLLYVVSCECVCVPGSEIDQVVQANQGDVKFDWSGLRKAYSVRTDGLVCRCLNSDNNTDDRAYIGLKGSLIEAPTLHFISVISLSIRFRIATAPCRRKFSLPLPRPP